MHGWNTLGRRYCFLRGEDCIDKLELTVAPATKLVHPCALFRPSFLGLPSCPCPDASNQLNRGSFFTLILGNRLAYRTPIPLSGECERNRGGGRCRCDREQELGKEGYLWTVDVMSIVFEEPWGLLCITTVSASHRTSSCTAARDLVFVKSRDSQLSSYPT